MRSKFIIMLLCFAYTTKGQINPQDKPIFEALNQAEKQSALGDTVQAFNTYNLADSLSEYQLEVPIRIAYLKVCVSLNKKEAAENQIIQMLRKGDDVFRFAKYYPLIEEYLKSYTTQKIDSIKNKFWCKDLDYKLGIAVTNITSIDQYVRESYIFNQDTNGRNLAIADSTNFESLIKLNPLPSDFNIGFSEMGGVTVLLLHYGRYSSIHAEKAKLYLNRLLYNRCITPSTYAFITDHHRAFGGLPYFYGVVPKQDRKKYYEELTDEEKERINANREKIGLMSVEDELIVTPLEN